MPFPFTLPTTSSFSFSSAFDSSSHPSLPTHTTTYRSVLRDSLKKHKRLPPPQQSTNLSSIIQAIENYLPYLFAIDAGLSSRRVADEEIDVVLKSTPVIEWRPTLTASPIPGRENPRVKLKSLEFEIYFVLSAYATANTLLARSALHPLYTSAAAPPSPEQRTTAITTATRYLLTTASIMTYLTTRSDSLPTPSPTADIRPSTFRALAALALAEATLLAVLKDDPYPAAVAQERNTHDKEWMIHAPAIPKVRAHLFARLCLAAAEHAEKASSLLRQTQGSSSGGKIDDELLRYVEDLRKAGRAKACRFLGIDADLGGQTGVGIAWLRAGQLELGLAAESDSKKSSSSSSSSSFGLNKLKANLATKREDRRVLKEGAWGADGGKAEEGRVLAMLSAKWTKQNDTMNTQIVPAAGPLVAQMPSGREVHAVKPWVVPELDARTLEGMRGPPDEEDGDEEEGEGELESSSDEEGGGERSSRRKGRGDGTAGAGMAGTFPGTKADYAGSGSYY